MMETITITNDGTWQPRCVAFHRGEWMIEPEYFKLALRDIQAGRLPARAERDVQPVGRYPVDQGIAMIGINGPMMKGHSKYGGANTVDIRNDVRHAQRAKGVKAIMLLIDSPGGTVAGTGELARDVRDANAVKPVYAHIEDLGASAAYWVASQAGRVTATETSQVGSIGTIAVIEDSSGAAEMAGVEVHVVASAPLKGAFVDGTKVTDEELDYVREQVDDANGHFLQGVKTGRRLSIARVREAADGRVYSAANAKTLGLIDAVSSVDQAVNFARRELSTMRRQRQDMAMRVAEAGAQ